MKKRSVVAALVVLALFSLSRAAPVRADAAPPEFPPGASIDSGGVQTHVQMLSEQVDITIGTLQDPFTSYEDDAAHVEAYFYMLNQGDKSETLDVRFPLKGLPGGDYYEGKLDDFQVWVGHHKAEVLEQNQPLTDPDFIYPAIPWAVWSTTFDPGVLTTIHVTYQQRPHLENFNYILETGAGWFGPIGDGAVVVHYPYELTSLNSSAGASEGTQFTTSGADMTWTFTNLEPTHASNISFSVMAPSTWGDILAARQRADRDPGSLDAQLGLARALQQGLWIKYEVIPMYNSDDLIDAVCAAYESALKIDPRSVDTYHEYLRFVDGLAFFMDPPDPRLPPLLARALSVAPDNQDFLAMQSDIQARYATATQQSTEQAVLALTPSSTFGPTRTPAPTFTLGPTDPSVTETPQAAVALAQTASYLDMQSRITPTTTPSPSVTPTAPSTSTAPAVPAAPSPSPAPPPPGAGNIQDWNTIVLPVVIFVIIFAVWLRRRRRGGPGPGAE